MCSRYFLRDRSLKSMYEMEGYDTSIYHKLHLFLRILYSSENSRIKCVMSHFRHSSPKQVTPKKGFPLEKRGPCTSACAQVTQVSSGWKDNLPCTGADGERRGVGG